MEADIRPGERSLTRKMSSSSGSASGQRSSKKRVRNFSADDRAAHRIFEKGRREAFRERLISLASLLPSLAETESNRLSKHVVVDESIARHRLQQSRCSDALREMRALLRERDELLAEVNEWRQHYGSPQTPLKTQAVKAENAISGLAEIESEVYGDYRDTSSSSPDNVEGDSSQGNDSDEWQGVISAYSDAFPPWSEAVTGEMLARTLIQEGSSAGGRFSDMQVSTAANSLVSVLDVPSEQLIGTRAIGQSVTAGLDGIDLSILNDTSAGEAQNGGIPFDYEGQGLPPFDGSSPEQGTIPFEQYLKPFSGYFVYGFPSVQP